MYDSKGDTQLHKLQLHNFMNLCAETEYEEYDPDWLYLRVVKYVEGTAYDFSKLDSIQCQVIRVNQRKDTVADLESRLSELFDIPVESLAILQRHEHIYNNSVRTDLFNIDCRREKTIADAGRLDHGTILYVEESVSKEMLETLHWQ